jgi:hypothetical protein
MNDTNYPIVREEEFRSSLFATVPRPGPDRAILLVSTENMVPELLIRETSVIKPKTVRNGKYNKLIEINTAVKTIRVQFDSYCSNNANKFAIRIDLQVTVEKPERIYRDNIRDMESYLSKEIELTIRDISKKYDVNETEELKHNLTEVLKLEMAFESGVKINLKNVLVDMDEEARRLFVAKQSIKNNVSLEEYKAEMAGRLLSIYTGDEIAVFEAVTTGNITAEEAREKLKGKSAQQFDEGIRRITELTKQVKNLYEDGVINAINMSDILKNSFNEVAKVGNVDVIKLSTKDSQPMDEEGYMPIED